LKRNDLLLLIVLDVAVYHIHRRIHAKQVPEFRLLAYEEAKDKLDKICRGQILPGLPMPTLAAGEVEVGNIVIQSNPKRNNSWG
jgi:hypothetical protein